MDIEPQQEEEQQQHEFAWVMANSNNTLILTHHEQPMGRLRVAKVVSGVAWPRPRGLWSRSLAHHVLVARPSPSPGRGRCPGRSGVPGGTATGVPPQLELHLWPLEVLWTHLQLPAIASFSGSLRTKHHGTSEPLPKANC